MSENKRPTVFSRRRFLGGMFCAGVATAIIPMTRGHGMAAEGEAPAVEAPAEAAPAPAASLPKKPLVVYFSHSGNTRELAKAVNNVAKGDLLEIIPVNPYPEDYDTLVNQAKNEQKNAARPPVKYELLTYGSTSPVKTDTIPNMEEYGVILLGYPNWWSSMPMPVYTFLEKADLGGKVILPFNTHGGGKMGHSYADLKKLLPNTTILVPSKLDKDTKEPVKDKKTGKEVPDPGRALSIATGDKNKAFADKEKRPEYFETEIRKWLGGLGTALIETTTGNTKLFPDGEY